MPNHKKSQSNANLVFSKSSVSAKRSRNRKKKLINRRIGLSLILLQIVFMIIFFFRLFQIDILPAKYVIMIIVVLFLITLYNIVSQYTKSHAIGKCLSLLLSVILLAGSFLIGIADETIGSISGHDTQTDIISVIVLKTDPANSIEDAASYMFGHHSVIDTENTTSAIADINKRVNGSIQTSPYTDWSLLIDDLYTQKINAIIINSANADTLAQEYTDFKEKTKIIDSVTIESKIKTNTPNKEVHKEPFTLYLAATSFDDEERDPNQIRTSGKSDVNIVAAFNPTTRQAVMISTPRDYYVPIDTLSSAGIITDKLTHAGNNGIDSPMATLENLYGTDIDYYVKVNFTGLKKLVDELGGITVDSEIAFRSTRETSLTQYNFVVGPNDCDGDKALVFCRERMAYGGGDFQRGRNQLLTLKAIIAKASSPAILQNYSGILSSLEGLFVTSMPQSSITDLIKDMLNDGTPWNIHSYDVSGTGGTKYSPGTGSPQSVVDPDYKTVNIAIELINKVQNGEIFDLQQFLDSQNDPVQ